MQIFNQPHHSLNAAAALCKQSWENILSCTKSSVVYQTGVPAINLIYFCKIGGGRRIHISIIQSQKGNPEHFTLYWLVDGFLNNWESPPDVLMVMTQHLSLSAIVPYGRVLCASLSTCFSTVLQHRDWVIHSMHPVHSQLLFSTFCSGVS